MIEKKEPSVALDIDGVLSCFSCGVLNRAREMGLAEHFPTSCRDITFWDVSDYFSKVMNDAWLDPEFWLQLPTLEFGLPFKPVAYITSRPIATEVTKQWLDKYGFPEAEVITVSKPDEKLEHLKRINPDIYVDDLYSTVRSVRDAGINAYLYDAPYQRGHVEDCKDLPKIYNLQQVLDLGD